MLQQLFEDLESRRITRLNLLQDLYRYVRRHFDSWRKALSLVLLASYIILLRYAATFTVLLSR